MGVDVGTAVGDADVGVVTVPVVVVNDGCDAVTGTEVPVAAIAAAVCSAVAIMLMPRIPDRKRAVRNITEVGRGVLNLSRLNGSHSFWWGPSKKSRPYFFSGLRAASRRGAVGLAGGRTSTADPSTPYCTTNPWYIITPESQIHFVKR